MNILDFIILLCFIPAVINGLKKGFIAQVMAIIALVFPVHGFHTNSPPP